MSILLSEGRKNDLEIKGEASHQGDIARNYVSLNSAPISRKSMSETVSEDRLRLPQMWYWIAAFVVFVLFISWYLFQKNQTLNEEQQLLVTRVQEVVAQQVAEPEVVQEKVDTAIVSADNHVAEPQPEPFLSSVNAVEKSADKDPPPRVETHDKPIVVKPTQTPKVAPIERTEEARASREPSYLRLLTDAGDAFRSGNYQQAITLYRAVLKAQPQHKQALLGLMASLQSSQNQSSALIAVQDQLMAAYPFDLDVNVLIFDQLAGDVEARLKGWLLDYPKHALLHYKLGAYYVSLKRWSEAQNAFYKAVSLDKQQPEYAANLAIVYDHLGERQLAIEAYQMALSTASRYPNQKGMNVQAVSDRLRYLQSQQE